MVRAFVTVFFVFIVTGVTVAGGAVGVDQSRSQLSTMERLDTVGRTAETGWQMNAQRDVDSAAGSESKMDAVITGTSRDIPRWLISFAILVLVLVAGGVVYRSGIRTEDETDTPTSTIAEEDLIPNDDRVLMLLRDNDGQMRQANIVHETGWSKSKVSVVLSEMDNEDRISKLRIGRENIICITGDEPEAARSPFDDEG